MALTMVPTKWIGGQRRTTLREGRYTTGRRKIGRMTAAAAMGRAEPMYAPPDANLRLAPQAETGHDVRVTIRRSRLEIVEQLAALIDHLQQTAAGRVIALVRAEMLAQA